LAVDMDAQFNLSQDSWLPVTDYPRASRSFPRIAGSGNEIGFPYGRNCREPVVTVVRVVNTSRHVRNNYDITCIKYDLLLFYYSFVCGNTT
jgi:hypothetical protein